MPELRPDMTSQGRLRRSWPVWKAPPDTKNPAPDGTGSGADFETTGNRDNTATASLLQAGPAPFAGLVREIAEAVAAGHLPVWLAHASILAAMCRHRLPDAAFGRPWTGLRREVT